jgi:small subunit ribosomal protein S17
MDTSQTQTQNAKGKELFGVVVKSAMKNTITVSVDRYVKHPRYKKYIRRSKKYLVHSPNGARVGDKVVIRETKPLSKRKHFVLVETVYSQQEPEDTQS